MSIHEGAKATITIDGKSFDVTDLTAPVDMVLTDGLQRQIGTPPSGEIRFVDIEIPVKVQVYGKQIEAIRKHIERQMRIVIGSKRIRTIKPKWRRLKPGVWVKWTGWYARNIITGDIFPVILRIARRRDRIGNYYWATCIFGSNVYSQGVFYMGLAETKRRLVGYPIDPELLGFEFYKEN